MLFRRLLRHTATSGASPSHTLAIPNVSGTCGGTETGGGRLHSRVPGGAAGRTTPRSRTFTSGGGCDAVSAVSDDASGGGCRPTPMRDVVSAVSDDAVLAFASASHAVDADDAMPSASHAVSVVDADDAMPGSRGCCDTTYVPSRQEACAPFACGRRCWTPSASLDAVSVVAAEDATSDDALLAGACKKNRQTSRLLVCERAV
jgi:hypothetical protein